jgi:hypothetical protein
MIKADIFVFSFLILSTLLKFIKKFLFFLTFSHLFKNILPMFFALFLLISIGISAVNGWGTSGHSLVASIAQSMLTNDSQTFVRNHLPWYTTGDLSMVASWSDTILYPDTNPDDYLNWQWSKELHYVNTPDWVCNYSRNRDCDWKGEQGCVDGAIQNYTGRLANAKQDDVQREEALKFLVHFIGDVHQPLHAGFAGDRGGNNIRGKNRCSS